MVEMADRKRQLGGHSFLTASDPCHIQDKIPYEFYCSIETTADYRIAVVYTLSTTGMFDGILFLFLSAFFVVFVVVMTFTRFLLFCVCVLAGGSGPELDVVV